MMLDNTDSPTLPWENILVDPPGGVIPIDWSNMKKEKSLMMSPTEYRALLDLFMVSDPWPLEDANQRTLLVLLNREARERGFVDWISAYHFFEKDKKSLLAEKEQAG